MNILILGSGGREHAFAVKISQSKHCNELYIAPGNAGTALTGKNISINIKDFPSIRETVLKNNIDLVIVGPEEPLVNGIVDYFKSDDKLRDVSILGPSTKGAMLEGSKDYAKAFMLRNSIPTADYRTFTKPDINAAFKFLETLKPPFVLKADGLAAGKGVIISETLDDAKLQLSDMFNNSKFGSAGEKIVIEEFLKGIELSVFVLTDGNSYKILPEAKDYKRIGDNDTGPNTGGMGAISPVPFADKEFMKKVEDRIVIPTIDGLKKENIFYRGFVFIGLMNVDGNPFVIEYNVRMGDPETEAVLPRIKSDVALLFKNASDGKLDESDLIIEPEIAVTVVMVSGGYPGEFHKGKEILIEEVVPGSVIFHAGTLSENDKMVTSGGRVIAVTSMGKNIMEARQKTYSQVEKINFEGKYYRQDIGLDLF